jgi:hypothetical protein
MPTQKLRRRADRENDSSDEELSTAKKATLVRDVFTQREAFDAWLLRHPRGFAAALGLCGAPQVYFEKVAHLVRQSRATRSAGNKTQERTMAKKDKTTFSGISELSGNIPWEGLIGLLNGVRGVRLMHEIMVPMFSNTLELQNLTLRSLGSNLAADLKPKLVNAANIARSGLSDIATQDVEGAKNRLKDLEKAVQEVRDALDR